MSAMRVAQRGSNKYAASGSSRVNIVFNACILCLSIHILVNAPAYLVLALSLPTVITKHCFH